MSRKINPLCFSEYTVCIYEEDKLQKTDNKSVKEPKTIRILTILNDRTFMLLLHNSKISHDRLFWTSEGFVTHMGGCQ